MARKKSPKGANGETFFSQSQKEKQDAQARYEAEKAAALANDFPPKPDPNETP